MGKKHIKIGIMTFHWACNYGAVIQTYALQEYLKKHYDCEVEIIDYYPDNFRYSLKKIFIPTYPSVMVTRLKEFFRERKIKPFRKNLSLTTHYSSTKLLQQIVNSYDLLICGSDQIWNPSFTRSGEGKLTTAYFLDFGGECKRIAYAASFGCKQYPTDLIGPVSRLLKKFDHISVREVSGINLVNQLSNKNSILVCDPTLLPDSHVFLKHISEKKSQTLIGVYSLRGLELKGFANVCNSLLDEECTIKIVKNNTVPEWLEIIYYSKLLITNSFHGMMIALRFHRNFAVVLEKGSLSGMNDRFVTVLDELGLRSHIIDELSMEEAKRICKETVDWDKVEKKMDKCRKESIAYLDNAIEECYE